MPNPIDVTFLIPVFNLKEDRINNLKFIIPYIQNTGCRIIVVEQTDTDNSDLKKIINEFENVEHIPFKTQVKKFHKTGIINYGILNHVKTKYVWINDVDFYMRFTDVFGIDWTSQFIQPYNFGKKLNEEDSKIILSGKKLNVDFSDISVKYISMYGALSFIADVSEFISIGLMDESIYGWGYEDIELSNRVDENYIVQKMEYNGIHLWHPTANSEFEDVNDMAVITCHFNWCNFLNPTKNLNRFLNYMEAKGIPVYGVELSLTDDFVTKNKSNWKHIKVDKDYISFQKEACLNLIEKIVPSNYTKLAWIDADLLFTNENWYRDASRKLDGYKVIQLYEYFIKTDSCGNEVTKKPSVAFLIKDRGTKYAFEVGHPGGAWAARREFWKYGGLYPYSITGAGDDVTIRAIYDDFSLDAVKLAAGGMRMLEFSGFKNWRDPLVNYVDKSVSFISGNVVHEWHGDIKDRNYKNKHNILLDIDFENSVVMGDDGLIKIQNVSDEFYDDLFLIFKSRREDKLVDGNDMAIILCHFNWGEFITPARNLNRFIHQMAIKKIPVYGIELSLTDKFVTYGKKDWIQLKVGKENVCFQKEACINIIESIIPPIYKKIAWIDSDLTFLNDKWYQDTCKLLDTHKLVQMFDTYVDTNENMEIVANAPSMIAAGGPKIDSKNFVGLPGGAIAARRDMWKHGGLYPYCVMGGGDTVLMYTIYNMHAEKIVKSMHGVDINHDRFISWRKNIYNYIGENVAYVSGGVIHEWHGSKEKRKYINRYDIIKDVNLEKQTRLNDIGLVEFINGNITLYSKIQLYFKSRREDG